MGMAFGTIASFRLGHKASLGAILVCAALAIFSVVQFALFSNVSARLNAAIAQTRILRAKMVQEHTEIVTLDKDRATLRALLAEARKANAAREAQQQLNNGVVNWLTGG